MRSPKVMQMQLVLQMDRIQGLYPLQSQVHWLEEDAGINGEIDADQEEVLPGGDGEDDEIDEIDVLDGTQETEGTGGNERDDVRKR